MSLFGRVLVVAACVFLLAGSASAQHILKMADGRILQGTFVSASGASISFKVVGDKEPTRFDISAVLAVVFSTASPNVARKKGEPISVPSGRVISIQIAEEISSVSSSAGQKFFATLVQDFEHDGQTLARTGKQVTGRVRKIVRPKRSIDKAVIEVTLIDITIDGNAVPIITDWAGIVNDGQGNTHTVGPAVVTNALMSELVDGNHVRFPAGARIEFRLVQPLTIRLPLN